MRTSVTTLSIEVLCVEAMSASTSTFSSRRAIGPLISASMRSITLTMSVACSASCKMIAKARRISALVTPRLTAEMLSSNIAAAMSLSAFPAIGSIKPCVLSSFLAALEVVISVRIPVPAAWSSMLLLVDSRGLLAVVLRWALAGAKDA